MTNINLQQTCLIIIDMQKYYLSDHSSYYKYFNHLQPGCLTYIINTSTIETIPNIGKLLQFFRVNSMHIIFIKLCSERDDRSDLHRFFQETHNQGQKDGFNNIYPLYSDPMADIIDELKPLKNETIITKKTFSPFTQTNIKNLLLKNKITTLVMTGLATSQCVETSARDASEHGFTVLQIEDAQVDYDELTHNSSLYSSQGVCGNNILSTDYFISYFDNNSTNKDLYY